MFEGRTLLIATKHGKEKVIAPILESELKVKCVVAEHLNTDEFGTFTGEVEREHDPLTTARLKCRMAMDLYKSDLALASEGSFGAHPVLFFVVADDEQLILIDKKNDVEISSRELSTDTNFSGEMIDTKKKLQEFVKRIQFPSHGIIIRKTKDDFTDIVKGITAHEKLEAVFNHFLTLYGSAYVETDMRAMLNPTRMKVIETATKKLIIKVNSLCPECNTPGFGITEAKKGLKCKQCNYPTSSTLSYIYKCQKCTFIREEMYPNKKSVEDPQYCDSCNP